MKFSYLIICSMIENKSSNCGGGGSGGGGGGGGGGDGVLSIKVRKPQSNATIMY
jgi:hypothetical protein